MLSVIWAGSALSLGARGAGRELWAAFGLLRWRQADENVFERLWRWTEPALRYVNFKWQLGNFVFSAATLLFGAAVLVAAVLASRYLRGFLERRMTARKVDPGIQYNVLRIVHYTVLIVGLLYALRVSVAADFTSLAVIFTALSVGIGFGLQFIAGDIASGFILLFERPVRVGDFVTIPGPDGKLTEGRVKSINLRSSVVATNDNIAAVVPNSKLVNQIFLNWSYREKRAVHARVAIPVGVSYNSDVDVVTETLLRAAEGIQFVLAEPKPSVQFLEFGEFSLNFRLLVWTDRPRRHPQIKSEINYRIRRLFIEKDIHIPNPQRDVYLRGGSLRFDARGGALLAAEDDGEGRAENARDSRLVAR
jgi:small-conductance mechanosensitive channel